MESLGVCGSIYPRSIIVRWTSIARENVINMMTNEFPTSAAKKTYAQCIFLKKEQDDYGISDVYGKNVRESEFCAILEELVDFGISRYKVNYSYHYHDTNLVLYQKYTYEDACRLLNWREMKCH